MNIVWDEMIGLDPSAPLPPPQYHSDRHSGNTLISTMKKSSAEKLRGCAICKREFYTKRELEKHAFQYHRGDNAVGRIIKSDGKSSKKQKVSDDTTCDKCAMDFLLPTELERHMRRVHKDGVEERVVDSQERLKETKEISCSICRVRFLTPLLLEQHLEGCSRRQDTELLLVEEGEEGPGCFLCEPCGMEFSSLGEQEEHMAMHRGMGSAAGAKAISCPR